MPNRTQMICVLPVKMSLLSLLFLVSILSISRSNGDSCYAEKKDPYKMFASKTSYDEVNEDKVDKVEFEGCQPRQIYMIVRHGTRNPSTDTVSKMNERLPTLRDTILRAAKKVDICRKDLENLQMKTQLVQVKDANKLTVSGQKEMQDLAKRFKVRFPSLLDSDYSRHMFEFRYTSTERAEASARNFAVGLFGDEAKRYSFPPHPEDDHLLRFYKQCKRWQEEVNKNSSAHSELQNFLKGPDMNKVIRDVSERLGFQENITFDDLSLMYDICRYQAAWEPKDISPWCAAFKKDDLQILEYSEDIDSYAEDGYGFSINYEQACPPVRDLVNHFRAAMHSKNVPLGLFRFSHSGLLLKLYARLGLFRDNIAPRHYNFKLQKDREWRTSKISPFGANLAFVLLECGSSYQVVTYVQEKEEILPGCSSSPCPIETFMKNYASIADHCDVNTICLNASNIKSSCSIAGVVILFLVYLFTVKHILS